MKLTPEVEGIIRSSTVDIPPSQATDALRADIFFRAAYRLEDEGRHNLAKVYLARAIQAERAARSRR